MDWGTGGGRDQSGGEKDGWKVMGETAGIMEPEGDGNLMQWKLPGISEGDPSEDPE